MMTKELQGYNRIYTRGEEKVRKRLAEGVAGCARALEPTAGPQQSSQPSVTHRFRHVGGHPKRVTRPLGIPLGPPRSPEGFGIFPERVLKG
jgi:hypothetical protein